VTITVDPKDKNFLTEAEAAALLKAARDSRNGTRDHLLLLMMYRHGLRVSEAIDIRLSDIDLATARLFVRRKKGSLSTHQPIEGDELRALRAWLRQRRKSKFADGNYLFLSERGPMCRSAVNYLIAECGKRADLGHVHPHMLRHSTGYYLANKGYDTRVIQDYLGHANIRHTTLYTRTNAARFEGLWR
jgi:integrase